MYTTKKVKVNPTPELDALAIEAGRVYSKVISLIHKIRRKKGFWLSEKSVRKYMRLRGYNLHSQTVQAIIQFHDMLQGRTGRTQSQGCI